MMVMMRMIKFIKFWAVLYLESFINRIKIVSKYHFGPALMGRIMLQTHR